MSKKNDSLGKTLFVVIALCLVCSIIVSGAAIGLKPTQQRNAALDMQRNVLDAAGLLEADTDVVAMFEERVDVRLYSLEDYAQIEDRDAMEFDNRAEARDPEASISLSKSDDVAGIGRRENIAQFYMINSEDGNLETIVVHIRGYGLWGTMYGLLALESDFNTIKGLNFYEHSETPGLGGEIQNPRWVANWEGKKLYDQGEFGDVEIDVSKTADSSSDHEIDALSGATLTSNGVENTFQFWFGDEGYGPLLAKLRENNAGEANNG